MSERKGFWDRLIEGSISEPWPTLEEMLNNPLVQEEIRLVREAFAEESND